MKVITGFVLFSVRANSPTTKAEMRKGIEEVIGFCSNCSLMKVFQSFSKEKTEEKNKSRSAVKQHISNTSQLLY